ncbi:MAG: DNA polymerase [Thermoplasmataceae archaeon]
MLEKFFEFLRCYPKPTIHYAHFAQYDWRYILDHIEKHEIKCELSMRTERDIYQIKILQDDGDIIMRDSFALWPGSLKNLADSFCPELPKLKIDIENYNPDNPEHKEYAMRDIEILIVGLKRLDEKMREHFGIGINATTASTALKAWQYSLKNDEIYNGSKNGSIEDFIRSSYYGGIVFLTTTRLIEDCETYDINSSYPHVMSEMLLPDGKPSISKNWNSSHFGIYRCTVKSPDDLIIPIVPSRNNKGAMRWLSGEFETICTNVELMFAARHGYEIIEIHEGLLFPKKVSPFVSFVEKCKTLRKEYKGLSIEQIAKLMQNSLYGKFGSRRERTELFHPETQEDELGAFPFNGSEYWFTRTQPNEKDMLVKPEWAVFITAFARLHLLDTAYSVGVDKIIYGDTDSLTVLSGNSDKIDIGDKYGQFKLEKTWQSFRAIAPKVYVGILDNGKILGRAKGMPKKSMNNDKWQELYRDGVTTCDYDSLPSLYTHIKKSGSELQHISRVSSSLSKSINFKIDEFGDVTPRRAVKNA